MKLLAFFQTRTLVTIVASVLLLGGATAAFAATSAGQTVVQSSTHVRSTATVVATHAVSGSRLQGAPAHRQKNCPGLSDARRLATSYHLSTASSGAAVTAICALHQDTFQGTTPGGMSVTTSRVYGYGEIDQLLNYARFLASHDNANASGNLTDTNVSSYLADALQTCGAAPLQSCIQ